MLTAIVFSLNRAMQLEALLRSISECILKLNTGVEVKVLYGATSDEYLVGYKILQERFTGNRIQFIQKHRGKYKLDQALLLWPRNLYRYLKYPYLRDNRNLFNFKELLEYLIATAQSEMITFLTDDSLFYRSFVLPQDIFNLITQEPSNRAFSLRHGCNIQNPPSGLQIIEQYCSWYMYDRDCDDFWSYAFSIDGHIYSRSFIAELIKRVLYVNPNSFEGFLWDYVRRQRLFSQAYCFRESVLLSFPINMVQTTVQNESLGIDSAILNARFLEGYHLHYVHDMKPRRFQQVPLKLQIVKGEHVIDLLQGRQTS
jgi:hypothetical protein